MKNSVLKICLDIWKFVMDICFLLILVYGLFNIPLLFNYKYFVVLDEQNELAFSRGTLLYYHNVPVEEINKNDIIVYKPVNDYIVHKVIEVNKKDNEKDYSYEVNSDTYQTGHPNFIEYKNVLGKVMLISVVFIGHYINFVNNHMTLFYVILVFGVVDFFIGCFRNTDNRKNNNGVFRYENISK